MSATRRWPTTLRDIPRTRLPLVVFRARHALNVLSSSLLSPCSVARSGCNLTRSLHDATSVTPARGDTQVAQGTPVMQQYLAVRRRFPGMLVLFQLGDFFEAFFEDAVVMSETLGVALTHRGLHDSRPVPMAGVPLHAKDAYIARLVRAGYRVALCEQLDNNSRDSRAISSDRQLSGGASVHSDASTSAQVQPSATQSRPLMRRDVTRILSAGTITEETLLNPTTHNYLAAIALTPSVAGNCEAATEGGHCVITLGLAFLDISTGDFFTLASSSASLASDLAQTPPAELLICGRADTWGKSDSFAATSGGPVLTRIAKLWEREAINREDSYARPRRALRLDIPGLDSDVPISFVSDTLSRADTSNQQDIDVLIPRNVTASERAAAELLISYSKWALGSAAVLRSLRSSGKARAMSNGDADESCAAADSNNMGTRLPTSSAGATPVAWGMPRGGAIRLAIDASARRALEMTRPAYGRRRARGSLLHALDACSTVMGSRLLDARLCAPLAAAAPINARLDAVTFFHNRSMLRDATRALLSRFPDMERAAVRVTLGSGSVRDLCAVRDGLSLARALGILLVTCNDVGVQKLLAAKEDVTAESSARRSTVGRAGHNGLIVEAAAHAASRVLTAACIHADTSTGQAAAALSAVRSDFDVWGVESMRSLIENRSASLLPSQSGSASAVPLHSSHVASSDTRCAVTGSVTVMASPETAGVDNALQVVESTVLLRAAVALLMPLQRRSHYTAGIAVQASTVAGHESMPSWPIPNCDELASAHTLLVAALRDGPLGATGPSFSTAAVEQATMFNDDAEPSRPTENNVGKQTSSISYTWSGAPGSDVIRTGFNAALDAARALRDDASAEIAQLQQQLRERTGVRGLRVRRTDDYGLVAEVPARSVSSMSEALFQGNDCFRLVRTLKGSTRYHCTSLSRLDAAISEASYRAAALEASIFRDIVTAVAAASPLVAAIARAVAAVDVSATLAELASRYDMVRPTIIEDAKGGDGGAELSVQALRHLVVERALMEGWSSGGGRPAALPSAADDECSTDGANIDVARRQFSTDEYTDRSLPASRAPRRSFVPNDIVLGGDAARCVLLTGSNMNGKSTALRAVAHAVVLSHMGSFVPAASARLSVVDRLFARVGASDDVTRDRSTFLVEMEEASFICENATARSLVVVDEVGRGTAAGDGLALAWAILEHLATVIRCRTLFATHAHELAAMALAPQLEAASRGAPVPPPSAVRCLTMAVDISVSGAPFLTHRIEPHPVYAALDGLAARVVSLRDQGPSVDANIARVAAVDAWRRAGGSSSYGLHVAGMAGLPPSILRRAQGVLTALEDSPAASAWVNAAMSAAAPLREDVSEPSQAEK